MFWIYTSQLNGNNCIHKLLCVKTFITLIYVEYHDDKLISMILVVN